MEDLSIDAHWHPAGGCLLITPSPPIPQQTSLPRSELQSHTLCSGLWFLAQKRGRHSWFIPSLVLSLSHRDSKGSLISFPFLFIFFLFLFSKFSLEDIFIDFREEGRKRERNRNTDMRKKHCFSPLHVLTGDWIYNLGNWTHNLLVYRMTLQPTEPPSLDWFPTFSTLIDFCCLFSLF